MTSEQKAWKEVPIAGVCWRPSTDYLTGDWTTIATVGENIAISEGDNVDLGIIEVIRKSYY